MNTTSRQGGVPAGPVRKRHPFRNWFNLRRNGELCWRRVRRGDYERVYLCTPPAVTGRLLRRLSASRAKFVLAEKPWFGSYSEAIRSASLLRRSAVRFAFFDHYLFRPVIRWLLVQPLEFFLGGPIAAITGWLLESTPPTSPAQRVGVLSDLLIHLVSVCRALLPGCPIRVTDAQAARYRDAPSDAETFAHIDAVATAARPVAIALSAAKNFPAEAAGKVLLIQGPSATLRLDLTRDTADLVTDTETRRVFEPGNGGEFSEEAYHHLMRRLNANDQSLGMSLDQALTILRILEDARSHLSKPLPQRDSVEFCRAHVIGSA